MRQWELVSRCPEGYEGKQLLIMLTFDWSWNKEIGHGLGF